MQTAKKEYPSEILEIKNQFDISIVNSFLINNPEKALILINYWNDRIQKASPAQLEFAKLQVARLEAILLKMVDMTEMVYEPNVIAHVDNILPAPPAEVVVDLIKDLAEATNKADTALNEPKVVQMVANKNKPKYDDLITTLKEMLKKGMYDQAKLLAENHLTTGNYIPKKNEKAYHWKFEKIEPLLKTLNNKILEEKVKPSPVELNQKAAAEGLTTGEVEKLRLLNTVLVSSLTFRGGTSDYKTAREAFEHYFRENADAKIEYEILTEYAERILAAHTGASWLTEKDLADFCKDLGMFKPLFFDHRKYTDESVRDWYEEAQRSKIGDHFKFLKTVAPGTNVINTVDPPIVNTVEVAKAKETVKPILHTNEVQQLLQKAIKANMTWDEISKNPDFLCLTAAEIRINKKSPHLKFQDEASLLKWLETQYAIVNARNVNPKLPTATATETTAVIEEVKPTASSKEEVKPIEAKPVEAKPVEVKPVEVKPAVVVETANLDDFTLLIEQGFKESVNPKELAIELMDLVKNDSGKFKSLVSAKGDSKTTVTFANDADYVQWVEKVYFQFNKLKVQAIADTHSATAVTKATSKKEEVKEITNEAIVSQPVNEIVEKLGLVDSMKEFMEKGKSLVAEGLANNIIIAWAKASLLNRKLKEQKDNGVFKSEKAVEAFTTASLHLSKDVTNKEDITATTTDIKPETASVQQTDFYTAEDIAEIMADECRNTTLSFIQLTRMMRDLYLSNKLITPSIPETMALLKPIIKENNPELYAQREEDEKTFNKNQKKIEFPKESLTDAKSVSKQDNPVLEHVDLKAKYPNISALGEAADSMDSIYNLAKEFVNAGELNEALTICIDNLPRITKWDTAQVTTWFNTTFLSEVTGATTDVTNESSTVEDTKVINEVAATSKEEDLFTDVTNSKDKKSFRATIRGIFNTHGDKPEIREKIIAAMKLGHSQYLRQLSKNPDKEIQAQLNNIIKTMEKPRTEITLDTPITETATV